MPEINIEVLPSDQISIEINSNQVLIKGDKGDNAYQVALSNGFVGTEQEWLDSFQQRINHKGTQPISSIDNLQSELDSKVNIADIGVTVQPYDINLVTYTQTEKNKLTTIEEGAQVNVVPEWSNITNKPNFGTASLTDSNQYATSLQGAKADTALQPSNIGVMVQPYDVNLVTYTQAEKDKLAGIADNAEVNVQADWNATFGDAFIQNKPVLGTIASRNSDEFATSLQGVKADTAVQPADIANFETTTQLNNRDTANRNRANHTGTQAISTITGLQVALDGKQPTGDYATNTSLTNGLATKENIITTGTTAQYWRGDKTWQTLNSASVGLGNVNNTNDLSKPISTATQTALDLKANLASPTFTGNLTLPNNTRINGIEHFYQATKPTVRRDGSALVIGDKWWNSSENNEWFWNGTYWLSPVKSSSAIGSATLVNTTQDNFMCGIEYLKDSVLVTRGFFTARYEGAINTWFTATDDWQLFFMVRWNASNTFNFTPPASILLSTIPPNSSTSRFLTYTGDVTINNVALKRDARHFVSVQIKIGNPSIFNLSSMIYFYHDIFP